MIAAGSPCQGFSIANPNRGSDGSLVNVSMVASVLSFVDFYRPKYALLENVKGMASGGSTENMLALVVSTVLGMGYQVRIFALDAWSFGSPQSRSRIIISVTAPGLTPLPEPPHTHLHPDEIRSSSLGRTVNGLRSNCRYTSLTPFGYVSAEEATRDLPPTNARISCIRFPDHRMSRTLSTRARIQIGSIPRFPGGGRFITATSRGYMPQTQIDSFPWRNRIAAGPESKSWQRLKRGVLMPTIMVEPRPSDGANGQCLHWDEERLLTVMEARRAQGFPDDEVLVGLPSEQWKIIGNSVARPVAQALGISLRKAWLVGRKAGQDTVASIANGTPSTKVKGGCQHIGRQHKPIAPLAVPEKDGETSMGQARTHRPRSFLPSWNDLTVIKANGIGKLLIKDSD